MAMLYVFRDGADFYIHSDEECDNLERVETAPFKVLDFDMPAAEKARVWFEEFGYFKGSDELVWCR